jgi:V/A-type H+/Na+-transporting ATPase subunit D
MQSFKPTRMELLKFKKRIKLARKGHKLLKQKRDVLVFEFFKVLKEIREIRKQLSNKLSVAQKSLYNAISFDGNLEIERVTTGLAQDVNIDITYHKLMGVEIPKMGEIKVNYQWPGVFGTSVDFDNAIIKYRELFPEFIQLAQKQLVLKKISEEIIKTKRRVNSLEYIIIPNLEHIKKTISFKLEELERENFTRLKKIKAKTV